MKSFRVYFDRVVEAEDEEQVWSIIKNWNEDIVDVVEIED